ncbi:MAG: acyl-CoA dehydrogenase family protein [Thermoplasmatales archaeon]|nr:acyl-CoA dehydrogenase family protein [Thermoplasmatales archaeon]MCW6170053.1 acyl-CoA dehydrogenase family protein [Thermoplasmatales archaeon]
MVDFSFSEEQTILRDSVREFANKEIAPRIQDMVKTKRIPSSIITGMKKLGVLGMTIPEEYNGMGADAVTTGIVAEEIARQDVTAAISVLFLVDNAWSYLLSKYAKDTLRDNVLEKIAKGDIITGVASTEPGAGSDLGSMKTVAVKDHRSYIINGEKSYISLVKDVREIGGGYVTIAKTDPDKGTAGISLFYTPDRESEMELSSLEEMGREGSTWGSIRFLNYEVPEGNMIGEVNRGFKIVHEGFEFARGLIALISASIAQQCLDNATSYMKERKAFGQPIGRFQGIQFGLADHTAKLEAARNIAYKALWMYDKEQRKERFTRFEVSKEIAIAKLLSTVWSFDAINDALQWHGAFGYTKFNPQELALRGVRSFMLAEGSREIMKTIIARETLGREFVKG